MAGEKLIAENRRARHDYELLERFEAGLVLTGTEVKSLRDGRVSLAQAYADVRGGEVWLVGADISVYEQGNIANHEPGRDRKLLLHKGEISSLLGKTREKGLTLVPTRMYWKNGRAKIELALGRGKQLRDKRRDIAKREADRDMQRALKRRRATGRRRRGRIRAIRGTGRRGPPDGSTRTGSCRRPASSSARRRGAP
jgi:SsrA-binding protein